jgi:hypothetical protein
MKKFKEVDVLKFGHSIQMAGAIFSGEGTTYLCFFPEDREQLPALEVLDMDADDWQALTRQTDTLEASCSRMAADGTLEKVVLRKSQRQIDQGTSWTVFRRDGYACCYCGKADVPLTVDHLLTWEDGGPSTPENMLSACRKCNKARGNTGYREWVTSHPHYLRTSRGLTEARRSANLALADAVDGIQRVKVKSR